MAQAYGQGAEAWAMGPLRVYSRLAEVLVEFSPEQLAGQRVLDLGSGTGAGSRAALAAGATVVATDLAPEMLLVDRSWRPPAAAGDAVVLPFRDDAFDVVLAPFSLNHLDDPSVGVHEAGRVAPLLLASTYAVDDDHPAKGAVEQALQEAGWERPTWYSRAKAAMAAWGTVDWAAVAVTRGGMQPLVVERRSIVFDDLGPMDMVAWRLGMAPCAPFVAALRDATRDALVERALELLGPEPPPIERRVILITAVR